MYEYELYALREKGSSDDLEAEINARAEQGWRTVAVLKLAGPGGTRPMLVNERIKPEPATSGPSIVRRPSEQVIPSAQVIPHNEVAEGIDVAVAQVLSTLDFDRPCRFDHHGACQEHGFFEPPCPVPVLAGKNIRALDLDSAKEVAKGLLDLIEASGNLDAHAGAERMADILLGYEWNKTPE